MTTSALPESLHLISGQKPWTVVRRFGYIIQVLRTPRWKVLHVMYKAEICTILVYTLEMLFFLRYPFLPESFIRSLAENEDYRKDISLCAHTCNYLL